MVSYVHPDVDNQLRELELSCKIALSSFKAGGLRKNLKFWEQNVSDPSILALIRGLTIPFSCIPSTDSAQQESKFLVEENVLFVRKSKHK